MHGRICKTKQLGLNSAECEDKIKVTAKTQRLPKVALLSQNALAFLALH